MKKAIVTLLIGDQITNLFNELIRPTWGPYVQKHGWELIVITDYIDTGALSRARAPHWQKLLILENPVVKKFDAVAWVDADILINFHRAPCMTQGWDPRKIGVVSELEAYWNRPEGRDNAVSRLRQITPADNRPEAIYMRAGLPGDVKDFTNTGVLLYSPQHHTDVLRHIYLNYKENADSAKENVPLSYHIFKNELDFHLDPRFNRTWLYEAAEHYPFVLNKHWRDQNPTGVAMAVNTAWHNNYFLHFTGDTFNSAKGEIALREDMNLVYPPCPNILGLTPTA